MWITNMLQEVGDDPSDEKVKEFVLNTLKGGVNMFFFFLVSFLRDIGESKALIFSGEHTVHCLLIKMARFGH